MKPRSKPPVRRRTSARRPAYPRLVIATAFLGAACNTPNTVQPHVDDASHATSSPAVRVSAAAASSSTVSAAPSPSTTSSSAQIATPATPMTGADLAARAPKSFPEDTVEIPYRGCRGKCPPPWQIEARKRDRLQTTVRLEYCVRAALGAQASKTEGNVEVKFRVDKKGRVDKGVEVKMSPGLPSAVADCAKTLIEKTQFLSSHDFERGVDTSIQLPLDDEKGENNK